MTRFPKYFSKQFWWGYRWSLCRPCWCAMTSCFGGWWKPVWFSKKVFLNFSSNLDDTLSRLQFSEPHLLQKFSLSICGFLELSPIWARSPPSRCALCCGIVTRLFFHPRTRRIRGVIRVMLCSRIGGISVGLTQHWSGKIKKSLTQLICWSAPFLRCFSQIVAIHHGIHPSSSGQLQQLRKGSFRFPAYRCSAISFNFER